MTRTVYYTATTLDGYIADQHDSLDWLFVQDIDPAGPNGYEEFFAGVGALVMGRTTYEWVREHLRATAEAWSYSVPTWVVTHAKLSAIDGADLRFAEGPVAPIHADATRAAGGKDVWIVGGGDLAGQFADAGLLDQLVVSIAPVTLGAGRPLFPRRADLTLRELAQNRAFVCATYDVRKRHGDRGEGPGSPPAAS